MRALMFLLLALMIEGIVFYGVLSSTTWIIITGFVASVVFAVEFINHLEDTLP